MASKIDKHYMRITLDSLKVAQEDGGEGSGNHNHAGRPGQVGGSAPSGVGSRAKVDKSKISTLRNFDERCDEAEDTYKNMIATFRKVWVDYGKDKKRPEQYAYFDKFEKSVPKWNKAAQKAFEKFDFSIRADGAALCGILSDGVYKTQMETGTSRGLYDPIKREDISQSLFGNDTDADDSTYEAYGFLDDASGATQYGGFRIVLDKDKVFNRTTFTMGDSLDMSYEHRVSPSYVNDPHVEWDMMYRFIYDLGPDSVYEWSENLMQKFANAGHLPLGHYVELQFHGGITTDDIAYIEAEKNPNRMSEGEIEEIEQLAKGRGIEIRWI